MATVVVQCNYPNGLTLRLANGKEQVVKGHLNATIIEGGYGLTAEVDAEFWNAWLEENKDFPVVKNGCVLVANTIGKAIKEAEGNKGVKSGNEQTAKPKNDQV